MYFLGQCNEFERHTNIHECGYYTPEGFIDQWAIKVTGPVGQSNDDECPESIIEGEALSTYVCIFIVRYLFNSCYTSMYF